MAPKFKRDCPICHKPELLYLSDHLSQVHQLSSDERKPWLKVSVFSHATTFPYVPTLPFWGMQQQTMGLKARGARGAVTRDAHEVVASGARARGVGARAA